MKRAIIIITAFVFVISMMGTVFAADVDTKMLKWTANTVLANYGMDKEIVKAVKAQNKKDLTLSYIKDTDRVWRGILSGTIAIQDDMMVSPCAEAAKKIVKAHSYLFEIFVTDNQGANVCMTDKTGDYWQGDEAKFVEAFNGGIGSVLVADVEVEDGKNLSQVSVPVMNKGRAIGTMTFGVNVDVLK